MKQTIPASCRFVYYICHCPSFIKIFSQTMEELCSKAEIGSAVGTLRLKGHNSCKINELIIPASLTNFTWLHDEKHSVKILSKSVKKCEGVVIVQTYRLGDRHTENMTPI